MLRYAVPCFSRLLLFYKYYGALHLITILSKTLVYGLEALECVIWLLLTSLIIIGTSKNDLAKKIFTV